MFRFGKTSEPPPRPKNFKEIIAPLTDITANLDDYVEACDLEESDLEVRKAIIENEIADVKKERSMSDAMAKRLREFTGAVE